MKAQDVMTKDPVCCVAETALKIVAQFMVEFNCGAIPIVENKTTKKVIGMITDRDITCRAVAHGRNPLEMTAGQLMSAPLATVTPNADLEECCHKMERSQVRRLPVVDRQGRLRGVITQAQIARHAAKHTVAEVLKKVSQPSQGPSRLAARL